MITISLFSLILIITISIIFGISLAATLMAIYLRDKEIIDYIRK